MKQYSRVNIFRSALSQSHWRQCSVLDAFPAISRSDDIAFAGLGALVASKVVLAHAPSIRRFIGLGIGCSLATFESVFVYFFL